MNLYQLLDYDVWATKKLLEATEALSPEQFVHEFAGSLSSVRQQFVHLLSVTDRYRARLGQEAVPDISPESFTKPHDLLSYEAQMRQRLDDFIANIDEDSLNQVIEHVTRKGLFQATISQTLFHMVNHATYHRGQVAYLLKLHSIDFADTDFIIWINQTQAGTQ